ncbi:MAG TPA: DUF1570 domain-containing protein, partial [Gemmataceae bacterium]|nr:DUF1570 domain-containing protein [Gemmataceae bacterium]
TLLSNAHEDLVRRAVVRLEQVYRAYARYLPPRQKGGKPTRIVLFRSLDDYQGFLKEAGDHVLNPAFYDPDTNRILCASNLERLAQQLADARKHHREMLADLKRREREWRRQNHGHLTSSLADYLHRQRVRIEATNRRNNRVLDRATQHLFQTLYHEAFHAYLDNFVYPHRTTTVPRWLNEGLAQIFEAGIVEAGEVRVGAADPDRLDRLRQGFAKGTALSLIDILHSGFSQFVVERDGDQARSSEYYLHSWALAHYLMFERKLLGTSALDRYVLALHQHVNPASAFQELVGQPLPEFEKDFRSYVRRLQPDGTVAARPAK